jgi:hypothetical protein
MTLYKEDDDNPLLNDFGCYILDRLHKVQNMQEYALPPVCDTDPVDIDKYVSCSKTLEDRTTIYNFSKELLAYLKTFVAFSPYYYADDPRSSGNIDKYYKSALDHYMDIEYEQFHEYLAGRLKMWYRNHPLHRLEQLKAPPAEAAVKDVIDGNATGSDGARQKRRKFNMEITAPAAANATAAADEGAAQSSATTTPATPAGILLRFLTRSSDQVPKPGSSRRPTAGSLPRDAGAHSLEPGRAWRPGGGGKGRGSGRGLEVCNALLDSCAAVRAAGPPPGPPPTRTPPPWLCRTAGAGTTARGGNGAVGRRGGRQHRLRHPLPLGPGRVGMGPAFLTQSRPGSAQPFPALPGPRRWRL